MKKILLFPLLTLLCCNLAHARASQSFKLDIHQHNAGKTILNARTVPRLMILRSTPALLARFQSQTPARMPETPLTTPEPAAAELAPEPAPLPNLSRLNRSFISD